MTTPSDEIVALVFQRLADACDDTHARMISDCKVALIALANTLRTPKPPAPPQPAGGGLRLYSYQRYSEPADDGIGARYEVALERNTAAERVIEAARKVAAAEKAFNDFDFKAHGSRAAVELAWTDAVNTRDGACADLAEALSALDRTGGSHG